jgi:hypothetical protein
MGFEELNGILAALKAPLFQMQPRQRETGTLDRRVLESRPEQKRHEAIPKSVRLFGKG